MIDWEKEAQAEYGQSFVNLSSFAQNDLRHKVAVRDGWLTPAGFGPQEVDVVRGLAKMQEKLAQLKRENRDLWQENEELKIENLELTDELNKSSSRRRT